MQYIDECGRFRIILDGSSSVMDIQVIGHLSWRNTGSNNSWGPPNDESWFSRLIYGMAIMRISVILSSLNVVFHI